MKDVLVEEEVEEAEAKAEVEEGEEKEEEEEEDGEDKNVRVGLERKTTANKGRIKAELKRNQTNRFCLMAQSLHQPSIAG